MEEGSMEIQLFRESWGETVANVDQSQKSEGASGNARYRWDVLNYSDNADTGVILFQFRPRLIASLYARSASSTTIRFLSQLLAPSLSRIPDSRPALQGVVV